LNSPEESNPSDAKPIYLYRILSRHRQPAYFWNMSCTITALRLTLQVATASRRAADLLQRVALKKRSIFVVNERQLRMKLQCDETRRRVVTGALIDKTGVGRISARPGGLGCPGNVEAGKEIRHQASNSPTLVSYNPRRTLFILIDALQQYWIYTGCHGKSCPSIIAAAHRFPMVIMEKGMGVGWRWLRVFIMRQSE